MCNTLRTFSLEPPSLLYYLVNSYSSFKTQMKLRQHQVHVRVQEDLHLRTLGSRAEPQSPEKQRRVSAPYPTPMQQRGDLLARAPHSQHTNAQAHIHRHVYSEAGRQRMHPYTQSEWKQRCKSFVFLVFTNIGLTHRNFTHTQCTQINLTLCTNVI